MVPLQVKSKKENIRHRDVRDHTEKAAGAQHLLHGGVCAAGSRFGSSRSVRHRPHGRMGRAHSLDSRGLRPSEGHGGHRRSDRGGLFAQDLRAGAERPFYRFCGPAGAAFGVCPRERRGASQQETPVYRRRSRGCAGLSPSQMAARAGGFGRCDHRWEDSGFYPAGQRDGSSPGPPCT